MLFSKQFLLSYAATELIKKAKLSDADFVEFKEIIQNQFFVVEDTVNEDGDTLLHFAFHKAAQFKSAKHLLLVRELIHAGASQTAENKNGFSPEQVYIHEGGDITLLKEANLEVLTSKEPNKEEDLVK